MQKDENHVSIRPVLESAEALILVAREGMSMKKGDIRVATSTGFEGQRASRSVMGGVFVLLFIANLVRFYPEWLSGWLQVFWFDVFAILIVTGGLVVASVQHARFVGRDSLAVGALVVIVLLAVSINSRGIGDLTYFARVLYAVLIVVLVVAPWFKTSRNPYMSLSSIVFWSVPPVAVVFALQMFPLPVLTDLVHFLYGTEKLRDIYSSSPRVYGSFHNANWAGVYLMVAWAVVFWRRWHQLTSNMTAAAMSGMILFMTLGTGSRTAVIGIIVALVWVVLVGFALDRGVRGKIKILGLITSAALIGLVMYYMDVFPDLKRFEELFIAGGLTSIDTAATRIDTWVAGWERFLESPWIGPGVDGIAHNSFITWLQAFGVIGFGVLLFLIVGVFYAWLKVGIGSEVQLAGAVFWGFLVMGLTAEFFFTTQLLWLVLPFIFGICFIRSRTPCGYIEKHPILSRTPRETLIYSEASTPQRRCV